MRKVRDKLLQCILHKPSHQPTQLNYITSSHKLLRYCCLQGPKRTPNSMAAGSSRRESLVHHCPYHLSHCNQIDTISPSFMQYKHHCYSVNSLTVQPYRTHQPLGGLDMSVPYLTKRYIGQRISLLASIAICVDVGVLPTGSACSQK